MFLRRFSTFTPKNSNGLMHDVNSLRQHISDVRQKKILDDKNHVEDDGVIYISTYGWSRDDVQELRSELMNDYHVMNCHTFKVMRLEPLINAPSETRKMFPTPFDGFKKSLP